MVMLQRLSLQWRENGYVTEVASFKEGEWSCYTLMAGRMVMLQR